MKVLGSKLHVIYEIVVYLEISIFDIILSLVSLVFPYVNDHTCVLLKITISNGHVEKSLAIQCFSSNKCKVGALCLRLKASEADKRDTIAN